MTTSTLTSALLKIPEIQTAALWFIEKYDDNQTLPWENFFKDLYTDFEINFPANFDKEDRLTFVGLTIINDYSLIPIGYARQYDLFYENQPLSQMEEEEISNYIIANVAKLVVNLYEATQRDEVEKFNSWLKNCVESWNKNKMVLQEQVLNMSTDLSVNEIAEILNLNNSLVYKIIQDAITRIDKHMYLNLVKFFTKVGCVKAEHTELNGKTDFLDFILEEINNGGQNISEPLDLLPQFVGVTLN